MYRKYITLIILRLTIIASEDEKATDHSEDCKVKNLIEGSFLRDCKAPPGLLNEAQSKNHVYYIEIIRRANFYIQLYRG